MKANELRIGNLVKFSDDGTIFTVGSIEEKGFIVQNKEETTWIEAVEFEPIPLTEEWLLKFGIKDLWIKESWKVVDDTSDGETFGWSMVVRNASYTKEIGFAYFKYVHQLQNLYFAITGEELTIGGQDE